MATRTFSEEAMMNAIHLAGLADSNTIKPVQLVKEKEFKYVGRARGSPIA